MNDHEIHWYVAKTYRKEKLIRQRLEKMGIDHFIPFHEVIREYNNKKRVVEEPVIHSLIFIRYDFRGCISLINDFGFDMRYIRDRNDRTLMIVPDKQMNDFMYLLNTRKDQIEFVPADLKSGDRVRVIEGDFAGIEGELVRIKRHKRVVVRIEGLVAVATIFIPGAFLEKI